MARKPMRDVQLLVSQLAPIGTCIRCAGQLRAWWSLYEGLGARRVCYECVLKQTHDRYRRSHPERQRSNGTKAPTKPKYNVGARACAYCSTEYTPTGNPHQSIYCSKKCNTNAYKTRNGWKPQPKSPKVVEPRWPSTRIWVIRCGECERSHVARGATARFCPSCAAVRHARIAKDRVLGLYNAGRPLNLRETKRWHRSLCEYFISRDGDRCGICNRRVDISLRSGPSGDPMGPSIDHIVPRSKGGTDDLANLRLTHWSCNNRRGNRGVPEQLRLVG